MSIPILKNNFYSTLAQTSLPIVIEFFATWCPKCAMMDSVYEKVAFRLSPQVLFYKVDIEVSEHEIKHLGIEIVPTFVFFQNTEILGYTVGVISEQVLIQRILECIKK